MKKIYTVLLLVIAICGNAQLLSVSPDFPKETDAGIIITFDASKGNQGLLNRAVSDVYIHIGCITNLSTSSSDWKYVKTTWATTDAIAKTTSLGNNKWTYTITGTNLRSFFGITNTSEKILKIACVFRSGDGNTVQRNADGSDMYLPIYDANLNTRIVNPLRQPTFAPVPETITKNIGDAISIEAKASQTATMALFFNGTQVSTLSGNDITATPTITAAGNQQIVARATSGTTTQSDTLNFYVAAATTVATLPAGLVDGINYDANGTSATLVLYAPGKTTISVLGDFNNWTPSPTYQMNKTPDGNRFWLRINGLISGTEYAYQYLIDNSLQLADYNTEKVLDKNVDPSISSTTYPNLKTFPAQAAGNLASIIQTGKTAYNWQVNNFIRPDKRNLVVYELLVRDFLANSNWQTLKDTLGYLKKLGINAIEVMPFNNFEGASSWGYNPNFYFAPDKVYGTETALKQFIDACHQQGFAVIMDMVLNHSFGSSPMVQMYWDATKNIPAANNPWFYQYANHAYNVGYEFNHYTQATIDFTQRVTNYWLTNYKVDGYRFDLAKGFTNINTCDGTGNNCDVAKWGNYDQGRVNTWDTIYNQMQRASPNSYCILEMFADNSEEKVLADYGMMPWGNLNYNFNQATMGYATSSSDLGGGLPTTYSSGAWNQPYKVVYQESHDEERLQFKNEQYGNSAGTYNVKDTATGLKRDGMAAAFWSMMPGPKMMWQFGEMGYDYSIGYCSSGNNCNNTDPKPARWDYLNNANRKALHDVFAKLLALRQMPNYLSAFVSKNVTYSFGNKAFNSLQVSSDSLNIVVVGNFDVANTTGSVTFQKAGTWYDYLNGTTFTATGTSQSISLAPGEYHVYLSRNPNASAAASSYTLASFTATRGTANIATAWATTNEVNLKQFELQRSTDNASFTTINTQAAGNKASQNYTYADTAIAALNATGTLYYRLKITGTDSIVTYSSVVQVAPVPSSLQITSFTGVRNTSNIALAWATANEVNVKQLELQRSVDNTNFGTINTQTATNKTPQNYTYSDVDAAALNATGTLYYRIKTTGNDGTVTYSSIVQIAPAISTTASSYKIITFIGTRTAANIALAWQTTNEVNVKQYELQRSTDNSNFSTIITRSAFNSISQGYSYADVDQIALAATGVLYYRLKITGNDGSIGYSTIIVVSTIVANGMPTVQAFPNPVKTGNLYIATNITGIKMQVTVVDVIGKVLQTISVDAGAYSGNIVPINISGMPNGMYVLKIIANNQRYTQRFVVQH